jgi:hypothetical protein
LRECVMWQTTVCWLDDLGTIENQACFVQSSTQSVR